MRTLSPPQRCRGRADRVLAAAVPGLRPEIMRILGAPAACRSDDWLSHRATARAAEDRLQASKLARPIGSAAMTWLTVSDRAVLLHRAAAASAA